MSPDSKHSPAQPQQPQQVSPLGKIRRTHHDAAERALESGSVPAAFEGDPAFKLLLRGKAGAEPTE